jgi:arginyl-tRNA synthetase
MGKEWAKDLVHVAYGMVSLEEGTMSTRKGNVIFLEDVINKCIEKAYKIIDEKNPNLENKEEVAKKIGVGAVVFTYLKNSREKDIVFDWKEMLSFEGETGPYVQYSYARANSILTRAGEINEAPDFAKLSSKEEFELVKTLENFNKNIHLATEKLEPSVVTRYVIEVAKLFNKFYNSHSVLNLEDKSLMAARLTLVKSTCQVIKNGLELIGIEVVEKM